MEKVVLACVFVASVAVAFDQTGSLHSECKLSTDCDGIGYWCSKNMTCQCLPGYVPNTELKTCLAAVGKKCQYDDNCIKGAFCKNQETCECKEFLLASFDKLSCNAVTDIDDPCDKDIQCSKFLTGTLCSRGKCACPDDKHLYNKKCIRTSYIGDRCDSVAQCERRRGLKGLVACQDNVCVCTVKEDPAVCSATVNVTSVFVIFCHMLLVIIW